MEIFDSLSRPHIYLITKGEMTDANFVFKKNETLEIIKHAVENKISLVQIREKQLSARLLFDLVRAAARVTEHYATKLLVNDRADIALAARADGVHLTEKSLRPEIIRGAFPKNFIVGVSAHTPESVLEAKRQKADFAVFSPVFVTPGKNAPQGLEKLREICEKANPFPVLGLGGIDETNYQSILKNSAGLAAIRFLNEVENLRKLNERFV